MIHRNNSHLIFFSEELNTFFALVAKDLNLAPLDENVECFYHDIGIHSMKICTQSGLHCDWAMCQSKEG